VARAADRLKENAAGDYFVDASCIDCDRCRQIAPSVYGRLDAVAQTVVMRQPEGRAERRRAAMGLVACPTASIGTAQKTDVAEVVHAATAAFPERLEDGVYDCGYASESSFGATSYLLVRPAGNVLVDSPRAAKPLMDRIRALGGVRTMVLTHEDDVADHEAFRRAFGCERVMHAADVGAGTAGVERKLEGDLPIRLDDDLVVVPVPGHTRGSVALLHRDRHLFTGDHLWWEPDERRLHASRSVCWYSWPAQTRSMARLAELSFEWVLPGHGRRWHAPSADVMRSEVRALVDRMAR
jgi:glyoxylase-like metal-dependent hydrolase (beta-lactamase superfamily II)/ferredoxin